MYTDYLKSFVVNLVHILLRIRTRWFRESSFFVYDIISINIIELCWRLLSPNLMISLYSEYCILESFSLFNDISIVFLQKSWRERDCHLQLYVICLSLLYSKKGFLDFIHFSNKPRCMTPDRYSLRLSWLHVLPLSCVTQLL